MRTASRGRHRLLAVFALVLGAEPIAAGAVLPAAPPNVLLATAHPDDETTFAGTVFANTHSLGGTVDLAVVTSGEGGFRYATLAESIYGLKLTDEAVGRAILPRIRQRDTSSSSTRRTWRTPKTPARCWPGSGTRRRWAIAEGDPQRGRYEYVFVPLPTARSHDAHQAAALLALEAAASLPEDARPAVLGATDYTREILRRASPAAASIL